VIAGGDQRDLVADGVHHAGALVTEHDRHRVGQGPVHHLEVGVAEPAGVQAHEDVLRLQVANAHALHHERPADLVEHGGAELHAVHARYLNRSPAVPR